MFNKGLVVFNAFDVFKEYHHMFSRLEEEFKRYNIKLDSIQNNAVLAYIDSNGDVSSKDLPYDFIIYLDKDYYIAKMLEKAGYRLFNKAEAVRICDDKMLTHLTLTNANIKMPKTINFPLRYYSDDYSEFLNNVIKELGFPMIVKEVYGSLGEQVHLVNNKEELFSLEEKIYKRPHIYQEYIKSSKGKDVRMVVINKKYVTNMHRVAQDKDEFKSNIETGGIGIKIEPTKEFIKTAEKVATIIDLDYCGLDLLIGEDNEPILCEVNANAYLSPIEKYSHDNVARVYVDHIYNTIYKS